MIKVTISDAKASLSDLLKKSQQGEEVTITSGRGKTPVARLQAMHHVAKKRLGVLETPGFTLTEAFYEPLPEEELRLWNGEPE